jgi:hypothetical protein
MRFPEKYKPKKFKPVIYKLLRRFATGLVFALLWDRFFNVQKYFSILGHAFFVLGVVFFALAWVDYLKIDGVKILHRNDSVSSSDNDDDYDENEEKKTALISNILAGFCFLLPSLFFAL